MKCICGYEEPVETEEQVEVFFKSGPRKGQLSRVDTIVHEVDKSDMFIQLGVEKGFGFTRIVQRHHYWDDEETYEVHLYACPKCHTVKIDM